MDIGAVTAANEMRLPDSARAQRSLSMTNLIWSFAPWVTFIFASRFTNLYGALAAGGAVGLVVFIRAVHRKEIHMLDVASIVYFAALGAVVAAVRPSNIVTWGHYAQAGSHGILTILVLGSVLIGHPFTESYARHQVPESVWSSAPFKALNRQISLVWAAAFFVGTISLIVAGSVDGGQALLRMVVPFGALGLAFLYTQKVSADSKPEVSPAS
jgi:hypothetical protein